MQSRKISIHRPIPPYGGGSGPIMQTLIGEDGVGRANAGSNLKRVQKVIQLLALTFDPKAAFGQFAASGADAGGLGRIAREGANRVGQGVRMIAVRQEPGVFLMRKQRADIGQVAGDHRPAAGQKLRQSRRKARPRLQLIIPQK